ncbi:protein COFACTOR ASSEMBLY OF COMPLEX C SUBUNIT B CCB4, chloroplastic isoform X4 [Capsicum annuum]|uniref:protein COFACTOR ASSEMBLY OF COMPLEX C SUBUNIT B CCB4, chloroplastic isoform X4 n=1 Tax=Capsicum annuum TaxID=4072 RepID=UPI001FB0F004|nr:protein COFACTOR ASSEMBLY OF COMPLEX C SUBUNIT B CCB4, chloroplastic isoform X4 [Capsicum annuum]
MEAGNLLGFIPLNQSPQRLVRSPRFSAFPRTVTVTLTVNASLSSQGENRYKGPRPGRERIADWVSNNDDLVRSLPIYVGGLSLLAVLFNRTVSGIAPVADASRAWNSLSDVTCCRSLVIVYDGKCILQTGFAAASLSNEMDAVVVDTNKLIEGSLYLGVLKSALQSYLANLSLYPGKSQLPFLPSNTQAVILQPLGDKGMAIIGGDTIRGFTSDDQVWITLIGEKLDATLTKVI